MFCYFLVLPPLPCSLSTLFQCLFFNILLLFLSKLFRLLLLKGKSTASSSSGFVPNMKCIAIKLAMHEQLTAAEFAMRNSMNRNQEIYSASKITILLTTNLDTNQPFHATLHTGTRNSCSAKLSIFQKRTAAVTGKKSEKSSRFDKCPALELQLFSRVDSYKSGSHER